MLKTDDKNRSYAYVDLEDIMIALHNTDDPFIKRELKALFKNESYNELGTIRISKNSETYKLMWDCHDIIKGDFLITVDMLSIAYTRASLEFNYEMRDRIFKYLNKYASNARLDKSNEELIQKIICDEKVMNYINKYNDLNEFINDPNRKKHDKSKKKTENKKIRSYVII